MAPTDVEQYKGVDVRCGPVPGVKCLGVQMKHRPRFETLDRRAKYNQIDTEDDGGTLASVDKRRFWECGILVRKIIGVAWIPVCHAETKFLFTSDDRVRSRTSYHDTSTSDLPISGVILPT